MALLEEIQDLQNRIAALKPHGISTASEEAQLAEKQRQLVAQTPQVTASSAAPVTSGKSRHYEETVDSEVFDSAGQFESPASPCRVMGKFVNIVVPNQQDKKNQRFWVFETDDPRIFAEKGRQIRSAITVSLGTGAFKLNEILTSLNIPYKKAGSSVSFDIPDDLGPVVMVYTQQLIKGKTEVRLDSVELPGATTSVVG